MHEALFVMACNPGAVPLRARKSFVVYPKRSTNHGLVHFSSLLTDSDELVITNPSEAPDLVARLKPK